jgi:hypothetical protein
MRLKLLASEKDTAHSLAGAAWFPPGGCSGCMSGGTGGMTGADIVAAVCALPARATTGLELDTSRALQESSSARSGQRIFVDATTQHRDQLG